MTLCSEAKSSVYWQSWKIWLIYCRTVPFCVHTCYDAWYNVTPRRKGHCTGDQQAHWCCWSSKCLMNDFIDLTFIFLCICILPGWKMISGIPAWNAAQTLEGVSAQLSEEKHIQALFEVGHFKSLHTYMTNKSLITFVEFSERYILFKQMSF